MTLSAKQKLAFQWFDEGLNFFITGSAGCGKSYILDAIASSDQMFKNIAVTASTGKAAHQIKGMTVHSFAGIEIGTKSVDYYYKHMQIDVLERWRNTHVLIIDEISMLNAETFDLLHHLACKINQCNDELFGGIQVITCGDFRQLPPVKGEYVFKSAIWKKYMFNVIELTESFRQENIEFFNALNEIRIGKVSDKTVDLLMTRHYEADQNINSNFIRLFFTNMEVDFFNLRQLMNIPSDERWFHSKDVIKNFKINSLFQIPISINLKIGAVVMLVKNINVEEGLCNGTIGIVTFIETDGVWVNINGREFKIENVREDILDNTHSIIASRIGLPLQLAFSLTVHKAQGCTLNKTVLNFNSKIFIMSLPYVALSRVKDLNDLYIIHNNKNELRKILKNITSDKDVDLFYKNLNEKNFVTC